MAEIDYCFALNDVAFMAIPKVATTSIKKVMFDLEGSVEEIHAQSARFKMSVNKARSKGLFIFTFVRNPFTRIVSSWYDRVYKPRAANHMTSPKAELYSKGMNFERF